MRPIQGVLRWLRLVPRKPPPGPRSRPRKSPSDRPRRPPCASLPQPLEEGAPAQARHKEARAEGEGTRRARAPSHPGRDPSDRRPEAPPLPFVRSRRRRVPRPDGDRQRSHHRAQEPGPRPTPDPRGRRTRRPPRVTGSEVRSLLRVEQAGLDLIGPPAAQLIGDLDEVHGPGRKDAVGEVLHDPGSESGKGARTSAGSPISR